MLRTRRPHLLPRHDVLQSTVVLHSTDRTHWGPRPASPGRGAWPFLPTPRRAPAQHTEHHHTWLSIFGVAVPKDTGWQSKCARFRTKGRAFGHSTKIVLHPKDDQQEHLDEKCIKDSELVKKHSQFVNYPSLYGSRTPPRRTSPMTSPARMTRTRMTMPTSRRSRRMTRRNLEGHPRVGADEPAEVPVDAQPTRSPRRNTPPSTSTSATTGRITSL